MIEYLNNADKVTVILFLPLCVENQRELLEVALEYCQDVEADYFLAVKEDASRPIWKGRRGVNIGKIH